MSNGLLVSRREGLVEAEVDGEIVALHVDNGTCYGFNNTATAIWKLLDRPKRLDEICEALAGEFEVDPAECERDVLALLRDLESDGLVDLKGEAGTA
ncbi:MAG: PqqD family protein [Allosphingosinicella sp.]